MSVRPSVRPSVSLSLSQVKNVASCCAKQRFGEETVASGVCNFAEVLSGGATDAQRTRFEPRRVCVFVN